MYFFKNLHNSLSLFVNLVGKLTENPRFDNIKIKIICSDSCIILILVLKSACIEW
jgi:hypothetical protein